MATETTTLTLPLAHLYYLTADSNNQTGYTLEEVDALIAEHGNEYEIEATITHPIPDPYTVEGDIAAHEARIANDQSMLAELQETIKTLEVETEEYTKTQEQIEAVEADIVNCEEYIVSLKES